MRYIRPFFALLFISTVYLFGCPNQPLPIIGNALHISMQVNAAGVPVSVFWDFDFTQPNNKACPATTPTSCVSGFIVTIKDSAGTTVLGAPQTVGLPATINATGVTTGISAPYNGPTTLGSYQAQVQVTYRDGAGTVQPGPVGAGPALILPSAPLNVHVQ